MDFAGSWYPATAEECRREVERLRDLAPAGAGHEARRGIVPHAGWVYSGRLAAGVFERLTESPAVELVVVLGGHLRAGDPVVAMTEGAWETPFGPFEIHEGFQSELQKLPKVRQEDGRRGHADNSIEVQLPFAKHKYPGAELLPIRVPPSEISLALGQSLAGYLSRSGLDAVVIASTDLTHYGPNYDFTPRGHGLEALNWVRQSNDPAFIRMVEAGDGNRILEYAQRDHSACSAGAVAAINEIALADGQRFQMLDYATSADIGGDTAENFVGYLSGIYC